MGQNLVLLAKILAHLNRRVSGADYGERSPEKDRLVKSIYNRTTAIWRERKAPGMPCSTGLK